MVISRFESSNASTHLGQRIHIGQLAISCLAGIIQHSSVAHPASAVILLGEGATACKEGSRDPRETAPQSNGHR